MKTSLDTGPAPVADLALESKKAIRQLARLSAQQKNELLYSLGQALVRRSADITAANAKDLQAASGQGISSHLLDRLTLTDNRIADLSTAIDKVIALPDPIGEITQGSTLPNGLQLRQIRVPLGVIGMIYEARPNVTIDAFVIAFKSSNAVLLRGSSSAKNTNQALVGIVKDQLLAHNISDQAINLISPHDHSTVTDLVTARGLVDLVIPRGGSALINSVVSSATVPTLETGVGNCHIYVDKDADLAKATAIILNAKTRRPSVCNTVETVLIHEDLRQRWLPELLAALQHAHVSVHGELPGMIPAVEADWSEEYLSLDVAIKIVPDLAQAIAHIDRYGTRHTEAIITENLSTAEQFVNEIDAAAVMVNASTAFTDGEQLGFGAEIGISTQKLHARGPVGLRELTTTKWQVWGNGQTRN